MFQPSAEVSFIVIMVKWSHGPNLVLMAQKVPEETLIARINKLKKLNFSVSRGQQLQQQFFVYRLPYTWVTAWRLHPLWGW